MMRQRLAVPVPGGHPSGLRPPRLVSPAVVNGIVYVASTTQAVTFDAAGVTEVLGSPNLRPSGPPPPVASAPAGGGSGIVYVGSNDRVRLRCCRGHELLGSRAAHPCGRKHRRLSTFAGGGERVVYASGTQAVSRSMPQGELLEHPQDCASLWTATTGDTPLRQRWSRSSTSVRAPW